MRVEVTTTFGGELYDVHTVRAGGTFRIGTAPGVDLPTTLATDFPRLWAAPATPQRERKRMVRLLLEDVTLRKGEQTIHMQLRWKGGATSAWTSSRTAATWAWPI